MFLMAGIEHGVRVLAWQKSKQGQNNSNPPKMIDPPAGMYDEMSQDARLERKIRAHTERENKRAELAERAKDGDREDV